MKNDRLRIPIDDLYLNALGLALICFARLEWNAVWCCEKLRPGYLASVREKTAGMIANDFVLLSATHADLAIAARLGEAAEEFKRLVKRRNDLVHANPGGAAGGAQRLFRDGNEWTIEMIDGQSDEFAAADIQLGDIFHSSLVSGGVPQPNGL